MTATNSLAGAGDPDVYDLPEDLWTLFDSACQRYADRPAYYVDGQWRSYAQLRSRVSSLIVSLTGLLSSTDRNSGTTVGQPVIAAILPNSTALFELFFVAAATRAILLPINTRLAHDEIERIFAAAKPAILVLDPARQDLIEELTLPDTLNALIWTDEAHHVPAGLNLYSVAYSVLTDDGWDDIFAIKPRPLSDPAQTFVQAFCTSGTTGTPKLAPHSHLNVSAHTRMTAMALELTGEPQCWGHFGPMYHVGDVAFVWVGVAIGAKHVFHDNLLRFDEVAAVISRERVTITKLVPTILRFFVTSPRIAALPFPDFKWILTGGDELERILVNKISEIFGCDCIQGYGMTEATCHVAFRNESHNESGLGLSVLEELEVQVLDEDEGRMGRGEIGEIAIRGPNVFSGYLIDATPSRSQFTENGFFHTGDLGYLDERGDLHIAGRKKDMLIVGGENVFARDVEQVADAIPGVRSSCAVGIEDRALGEVVVLALLLGDEAPPEKAIMNRLRGRLAGFRVPRSIYIFDEFPMTATGKVRKTQVREEIIRRRQQRQPADHGLGVDGAHLPIADTVRTLLGETFGDDFLEHADPDQSLFELDIDSLGMASLIAALEKTFEVELPLSFLFDHGTINSIIAFFETPLDEREATPARLDETAEDTSEAMAAPPPAAPQERSRRPLNLLLQGCGLMLRPGLVLASLLPPIWAAFALTQTFGLGVTFALSPLLLLVSSLLAATYLVAAKWLIIGRVRPGVFEAGTPYFYRWLMVHNLFKSIAAFAGVYRGMAFLAMLFRACGATIGKGAVIESLYLCEPDLISIGAGSIIERKTSIQPSLVKDGQLHLEPIRIGDGCSVAYGASIGPGADLEDHTVVPPLGSVHDQTLGQVPPPTRRRAKASTIENIFTFITIGYLVSTSLVFGFFAMAAVLSALGVDLASFHPYGPLRDTALVLGVVALARFGIVPIFYFLLVVLIKRLVLASLRPDIHYDDQGWYRRFSNRVYTRLIDVPFFDWAIGLTNMSSLTAVQYRLLGAKIGARPFFTAPYTTEPELLRVGDDAMIAGAVAIFPANRGSGRVAPITLAHNAAVANSCVVYGGVELREASLLGDLTYARAGFILQPQAIAVGKPPRIVGRTDFQPGVFRGVRYAVMQLLLIALQLTFGLGATILSWVALTPVIALLAKSGPHWWELPTIGPLLLFAPSLFTLTAIPIAKALLARRFDAGEYPLFGWMYVRWVLLEILLGRVEENTTSQFNGTVFARIFYESMGARVGDDVYLLGSPIGGEFDLKTIEAGAALNHQSKVFAHSIKRHTLIFEPTRIERGACVHPFSIVEAGATAYAGQEIDDVVALHAARDVVGKAPYERLFVNVQEFQAAAADILDQPTFEYFAGGAADQITLERNLSIGAHYQIIPQVLRDVTNISTRQWFLNQEIALPIMIAPMALQKLAHRDGEIGMARAARLLGIPYILSSLATTAMEDVAASVRQGEFVGLFQIYCFRNRDIVSALIARAERAGYQALVLTVDAPVSGKRERDIHNQFALGRDICFPHLAALADTGWSQMAEFDRQVDPSLTWEILSWIKAQSSLPLFVKGILRPDDGLRALDHGADAIIVSNHGGRQLDTTPATLEVLPDITHRLHEHAPNFPVYVDGGIRRGTDIFKALAFGAKAVLIGRPCVFGLAADGYQGVSRVLNILKDEFRQTMRLAGCRSLDEIEFDLVRKAPFLSGKRPTPTTRDRNLAGSVGDRDD